MIGKTNADELEGAVNQIPENSNIDFKKFNQCLVSIEKIDNNTLPEIDSSPETPLPALCYDEVEFYLIDDKEESKEMKACKLIIIQDKINLNITYPFKPGQLLVVKQISNQCGSQSTFSQVIEQAHNPLEGLCININQIQFGADLKGQWEIFTDKKTGAQFKITFQLQSNLGLIKQNSNIEGSKFYKLDFSATNLPLKPKKFSFFKSSPLISFYEIISLNTGTKGQVVYESDISKIESTDPFWTLTEPIAHSLLSPLFTVNIYQSIDNEKSKRALISTLTVSMDQILGEEKETMFEVPGTKGHTVLMLDRIQEVTTTQIY